MYSQVDHKNHRILYIYIISFIYIFYRIVMSIKLRFLLKSYLLKILQRIQLITKRVFSFFTIVNICNTRLIHGTLIKTMILSNSSPQAGHDLFKMIRTPLCTGRSTTPQTARPSGTHRRYTNGAFVHYCCERNLLEFYSKVTSCKQF